MRAQDNPIPATEWMYRAVTKDDVNGATVLYTSISLPHCSMDRDKYLSPDDCRDVLDRVVGTTGIAAVQPVGLPAPMKITDETTIAFEAWDDPLDENDAHCGVRIHRTTHPYSKNYKIANPAHKAKVRDAIAKSLRVICTP